MKRIVVGLLVLGGLLGSSVVAIRAQQEKLEIRYEVNEKMSQLDEIVVRNCKERRRTILLVPGPPDRWRIGQPAPLPTPTWPIVAFSLVYAHPNFGGCVVFLDRRTGHYRIGVPKLAPGQHFPPQWGKESFSVGDPYWRQNLSGAFELVARYGNNNIDDGQAFVAQVVADDQPTRQKLGLRLGGLPSYLTLAPALHAMYDKLDGLEATHGAARQTYIRRHQLIGPEYPSNQQVAWQFLMDFRSDTITGFTCYSHEGLREDQVVIQTKVNRQGLARMIRYRGTTGQFSVFYAEND